jgi:hypothetical protein
VAVLIKRCGGSKYTAVAVLIKRRGGSKQTAVAVLNKQPWRLLINSSNHIQTLVYLTQVYGCQHDLAQSHQQPFRDFTP